MKVASIGEFTSSDLDRQLVEAIESGLPLVSRPYAELAARLGTSEEDVLARLTRLLESGRVKRYGVVVRHHELGYRANGMVVWDIADEDVDRIGTTLGRYPCVTLCYRRPRQLPHWPYNLFTMVHGQDQDQVRRQVESIALECGLQQSLRQILFSKRRFKQRGACYSDSRLSSQSGRDPDNDSPVGEDAPE